MGYRIRSFELEKLRHCAFKGKAVCLSKELGCGGRVLPVITNLHATHLLGTIEYGFLGLDGHMHQFMVDPESRHDRRATLIPVAD